VHTTFQSKHLEEKKTFGRSRYRLDDNIKVYIKVRECEAVE